MEQLPRSHYIRILVPGKAVAQQRPAFAARFGHAVAFERKESRNYKAYVRMLAVKAMEAHALQTIEDAVKVDIRICKAVPKSFSKKKSIDALNNNIRPTTKPDVDNIAKAIMDALTSVVWKDDAQVCSLTVTKEYSNSDCVSVTVKEANA